MDISLSLSLSPSLSLDITFGVWHLLYLNLTFKHLLGDESNRIQVSIFTLTETYHSLNFNFLQLMWLFNWWAINEREKERKKVKEREREKVKAMERKEGIGEKERERTVSSSLEGIQVAVQKMFSSHRNGIFNIADSFMILANLSISFILDHD